jgi:acyl dehydratase
MLNYDALRAWQSPEIRHDLSPHDVMLYALGLGIGQDPLDPNQLKYTYEKHLEVIPSMACVIAGPGFWFRDHPELGVDWVRLVHGEQSIEIHRPFPSQTSIVGQTKVTRVVDKGLGKGALVYTEKKLRSRDQGALLATARSVTFLRADGGFSAREGYTGPKGGDGAHAAPIPVPAKAAQFSFTHCIRPEAALIYRLSGDYNPLHVDAEIAAQAGFQKPILHGLAVFGVACYGLLSLFSSGGQKTLVSMGARFSSPTYPGETVVLECWTDAEGYAFQLSVPARQVVVLSHGHAVFASATGL